MKKDNGRKGKRSGKVFAGTGITAAAAAVALFLSQKGCDFGIGTGKDGITGNETEVSEQTDFEKETNTVAETEIATTVVTEPEKIKVEVTIDGRDYIYNNKKMQLEELMTEISKNDTSAEIYISCESTATVNARDNFEEALESSGFKNIIFK
ncbi:MAG: hypothetical protein IKK66_05820 [Ruminococcus sp.]|nr:hypothetical protein [Ruminococcus sp.]